MPERASVVATLGTAQTLAWASTQYLPAILAEPIARDIGVPVSTVFAAFSAALVVAALIGPLAGRMIDRWGGRPVLMSSSLVFALGLGLLALSEGPVGLFVAWIVIGIGMGGGLYEAAFAMLVGRYGHDARNLITGITLVGGFASTIGWPLSTLLEAQIGWRGACATWAVLHLVLGLPLNAWRHKVAPARAPASASAPVLAVAAPSLPALRTTMLLAFTFAAVSFVTAAMAAHLPRLLQLGGATITAAVAISALVGPAQVAGRLLEFGLLRHLHPMLSARIAVLLHPLGAGALALAGAPGAVAFALLHGAGNGVLTIVRGTLPLAIFGPAGYGRRQAMLLVPARFIQAFAPWLFGLLLDRVGTAAVGFSAALCLASFTALWCLPRNATRAHQS